MKKGCFKRCNVLKVNEYKKINCIESPVVMDTAGVIHMEGIVKEFCAEGRWCHWADFRNWAVSTLFPKYMFIYSLRRQVYGIKESQKY